jgi:hypothetical protein
MLYLKGFLKDEKYNTPNWASSGIEQLDGSETKGEAQAVRAEYKDRRNRGLGR